MMKMHLNFDWDYKPKFEKKDYLGFDGTKVHLPHANKTLSKHYFDEKSTQFISSYQKIFSHTLKPDTRVFIDFEGVMSKAEIYLNGNFISEHVGGYTRFLVEITEEILSGENRLYVKVDARETGDHPPFGHVVDYLTYGGIYREVTLIETPKDFIEYAHFDGDDSTLNVTLYPNAKTAGEHQVDIEIYDEDMLIDSLKVKQPFSDVIRMKHNHQLSVWDLDNPKMYTAKLFIDSVYQTSYRFSVRHIKVTKDGFYLNGKAIFLRGLNRHQSYPYVGNAMPKRVQERDADKLKYELGVNIVRSSHYPPSKHFLNRCDEIGLLVFTELPGWQHIGNGDWKAHALNDLKSLVMNDYNHPSIVMIGSRINESKDDETFYTATRDLVKSIDISRPTGGVRFFGHSQLLEDIYTVNDFHHRGDNAGIAKKSMMTKKDNPYLITEYNGHMFPTKSFDSELHRIEHAKRHFKVLNDAYKTPGVMGAIGWCMNDYNTHKDFGSHDHICYHGVMDINRNDKYAASVYASQGEKPTMKVLSLMQMGELPNSELKEVIVATNVDVVKVYKNDVFIGAFTKESSPYKHLPYPPIIIKDFIGNQIHENESFSDKDATRIKKILLKTLEKELKMGLFTKIKMGYILLKYKLTKEDAIALYTKYIGGWGETLKSYRFEGIINNDVVITQMKGYDDEYTVHVEADDSILSHETTYDSTRITVELSNQFKERAFYASQVFSITPSDHLEIIGPNQVALQGGIQSFWIKTLKKGKATLRVSCEGFEDQTLNIKIT